MILEPDIQATFAEQWRPSTVPWCDRRRTDIIYKTKRRSNDESVSPCTKGR